MKKLNRGYWPFLILLVLSACLSNERRTLLAPANTATANNEKSTTVASVSLPTQGSATPATTPSPAVIPTFTAAPSQTPAPASSPICNSLSLPRLEQQYASLPSFQDAVVNSLNDCASPAAVLEHLRWIQAGFAFFVDLNQDGVLEIVTGGQLQLLPPTEQQFTEHAVNVFVIYLRGGKYKYKTMFEGTYNGIPEIEGVTDVDSDGTPEAMISVPYGGTWCDSFVSVIGWQNDQPIDYFREVTTFMECPAITEFVDLDGDGVLEVIQRPRSLIDYMNTSMKYEFNKETLSYYLAP